MFMVIFVIDDPEKCHEVLDAWDRAGVTGVTILQSSGLGRFRKKSALREDLPIIPNIDDLFRLEEDQHRTLMVVVQNKEMVDKIVNAAQNVVGNLNLPNTGVLIVLPVVEAYGLNRVGGER